MEVLHARCAGLDVHKETVVACVRVAEAGNVHKEVRSFGTATRNLVALADWLEECGCTHVAMEATGVYWKPVWHVLEETFALVLGNAAHIKNVPGRKTDVNDAEWLADLLAHGLIRASFVPEQPVQVIRALTRTRKQLVRERTQHIQRIQKTLEDANIKLESVATNVVGASGRAILEALIAGQTDPDRLADLAQGRLKTKRPQLVLALQGKVQPHHRFLLRLHLDQLDALDGGIACVEAELGKAIEPFRAPEKLLVTIPGVGLGTARVILAEIGADMSRFPDAEHLVSWARLCPRNDESAGKRRSNRILKGSPWLKEALNQAAWAAVRMKQPHYLKSQFYRIRARRGPKKAIVAVEASMLTAIWHMLRNGVPYKDLGAAHLDNIDKARATNRLVRRLKDLGYDVELKEVA